MLSLIGEGMQLVVIYTAFGLRRRWSLPWSLPKGSRLQTTCRPWFS